MRIVGGAETSPVFSPKAMTEFKAKQTKCFIW
jgi:hypothetical protein